MSELFRGRFSRGSDAESRARRRAGFPFTERAECCLELPAIVNPHFSQGFVARVSPTDEGGITKLSVARMAEGFARRRAASTLRIES